MKYVVIFSFIIAVGLLIAGTCASFYAPELKEKLLGAGTVCFFLIWIPSFLLKRFLDKTKNGGNGNLLGF